MATKQTGLGSSVVLAIGMGIGVIWAAMGAAAWWTAIRGIVRDRPDWGLAWGLIGTLLLAAGAAAAFGTWWHQKRVLGRD